MTVDSRVLVVDDDVALLSGLVRNLGHRFDLFTAESGREAIEKVESVGPFAVILSDIRMPGMDGIQLLHRMAEIAPATVRMALTGNADQKTAVDAVNLGNVFRFFTKPAPLQLLAEGLEGAIHHYHLAKELEKSYEQSIFMLGEAGHYNDTDTGMHIWRMASYAGILAAGCGWPAPSVARLKLAAPMHDTGKIGIPDTILKAPRALTAEEWLVMKQHTVIGYKILSKSDSPIFKMAAEIALCHHEKWDGSGYPHGLAGDAIPESARIVAMADVLDALTMKRSYKEPWSIGSAVAEIRRNAGTHFEPRLVDLLEQMLPEIMITQKKLEEK